MDRVKEVKIADTKFYPKPPSMWKRVVGRLEKLYGEGCDEYIRAWLFDGILVMASVAIMGDGREWLHLSFSRERKLPSYKELLLVKRDFIGEDKTAVMVFPDKAHYVNIDEHCLHLYYSAYDPLPDFSAGNGSI